MWQDCPGPGYAEVNETDMEVSEVPTEAGIGRVRGNQPDQQKQEEVCQEKEGQHIKAGKPGESLKGEGHKQGPHRDVSR